MSFLKKGLLSALTILIFAGSVIGQPDANIKKISPALLREDLRILTDTLKKIYPGLYRYKSKSSMDALLDSGLVKYTMAVKKAKYDDRGVIPDYPFVLTIGPVVDGKDEQMEYALKIAAMHG